MKASACRPYSRRSSTLGPLGRLLGLHAGGLEFLAIGGRDGDVAGEAVLGVAVGQLGFPPQDALGLPAPADAGQETGPGPQLLVGRVGRPGGPGLPGGPVGGHRSHDDRHGAPPLAQQQGRQEVGTDLEPGPLGDPVGGVPGAVCPQRGPALVRGHRPRPATAAAGEVGDPALAGRGQQVPEGVESQRARGAQIGVAQVAIEQPQLASQVDRGPARRPADRWAPPTARTIHAWWVWRTAAGPAASNR